MMFSLAAISRPCRVDGVRIRAHRSSTDLDRLPRVHLPEMSDLPYKKYRWLQLGHPVQRVAWWCVWAILLIPGLLLFRWRPGPRRNLPGRKPFLLLANHTSFFDPVWITYWLGRPSTYMASEVVFARPFLKWFLPLTGAFPKAFGKKDVAAMRNLTRRYEAGDPVVIFPEGARSYDGRPLPVLPGIGRTVKRMDATVVVARIKTGHLFHPRWAKYPRWVRVVVEHETLAPFDPEASPEQITAVIRDAMRIDPDVDAPRLSFGWRMAHGLPRYLWACPACFAFEGLEVERGSGNWVRCGVCAERWRLDTSNRMNGRQTFRVPHARDRVLTFYGHQPVADRRRFESEGIVLATKEAAIRRLVRGKKPTTAALGELRLGPEGLTMQREGATTWSASFAEISRIGIAFGDMVTVRVGDELFGLDLKGGSSFVWLHFLQRWSEQADRSA